MLMRSTAILVLLALLGWWTAPARGADAVPDEGARPTVIELKIESGGVRQGRDSRIFAVPVKVNGLAAQFTWGCGGWTTVPESFAKKAGMTVGADKELDDYVDGEGKPLFLGSCRAEVEFAGRKGFYDVKVMREGVWNQRTQGVIGFDIASTYQWEIDPGKPSLTLRAPGAKVEGNSLAVLPLKIDFENIWLTVKARNKAVDVLLMPQATDVQAAPDLQAAWDIPSGRDAGGQSVAGRQTIRLLKGPEDALELAPDIKEQDLLIILIGDKDKPELTPSANSGLGQSLLNRFVYRVDPRAQEFTIVERAKVAESKPPRR